jgi:hypothetical protein
LLALEVQVLADDGPIDKPSITYNHDEETINAHCEEAFFKVGG